VEKCATILKLSGRERFERDTNHVESEVLPGKAKRTESLIAPEDLESIGERVEHNHQESHN
jgi:hypothetical protein